MNAPQPLRVAAYCRKSVKRGLDQEFTSLAAQRESIESYVKSQRESGWVMLDTDYDDGGFSGATTDRPAFKRLIDDIESSLVDIVAVYKGDRLSRSLADFVQLMSFFEEHDVTFISVTEHFNTTTSYGKLTMNMLMSFAEFERSTTSERTRDKMAATRRRGQFTGGRPVLGYDLEDRKLVVNEIEATQVTSIFETYLRLESTLAVADELNRRGWTKKKHTTKDGRTVGGGPWRKAAVSYVLSNPIYIGKVRYEDELYEGQHSAVVDGATWEAAQALLQANGSNRRNGSRNSPSLLTGILHCAACGSRMGLSSSRKGTRRYRYYACLKSRKEGSAQCPGSHVNAGELEAFVFAQIRDIGRDPKLVDRTLLASRRHAQCRQDELKAQLADIDSTEAEMANQRDNLLEALVRGATDSLTQRLAKLDAELLDLSQARRDRAEELQQLSSLITDEHVIREALADFDPIWHGMRLDERKQLLKLLITDISFDPKTTEVQIEFHECGITGLEGSVS